MKKILSFVLFATALAALPLMQGCRVTFYDYDHGGWYYPGHPHGGYYPRPYHPRPYYPRGGGPHRMVADSATLLSQDFDISPASAEKIIRFARGENAVKDGAELGLGLRDMESLARLEMPAKASIERMAVRLGEDSAKIERVISSFIADIRTQQ